MSGITDAATKAGLDPETFAQAVVRIKYPNDHHDLPGSNWKPRCCMAKFKVRAEIDFPVAFAKLRKAKLATATAAGGADLEKLHSLHAEGKWPPLEISVDK